MKHFLSLLFIPQSKNNHRAEILKPAFILLFFGIYLLNQSFIKAITVVKPGVLGYSSEITDQKVYILTNQERANNNQSLLHFNSTLSESAQKKASDMFANNYWAHTSPQGRTPWDFFKESGYEYTIAGENLAKDFSDPESMLKAWMNSETHKANILNDKYKEIGIGIASGTLNGVKTTLVVQHFGNPIDPVVNNETQKEIEFNSNPLGTGPTQKLVLSATSNEEAIISPLLLNKIIASIIFSIIIISLIIDGYITVKNNTHRLTGSSTGHLLFIIMVLLLMFLNKQGTIF